VAEEAKVAHFNKTFGQDVLEKAAHELLGAEGATVSGTWGSCTTAAAGQCSLSSGTLRKNVSSATFSVEGVSHTDYVYDAAANGDPDGDSDGTTITVSKP
jgi:hypothetical protein